MIDYANLLASLLGANQQKQTIGPGAVGTTAQKAPITLNNGTIPTAGTQRTAGQGVEFIPIDTSRGRVPAGGNITTSGSSPQNYGGYVSPGGQNTGSPVASATQNVDYTNILQQLLTRLLQGRV